tara:strand:- start:1671 stop:1961 length:291 start_codon:yes stop_codon:yes gene_type:complete
VSEKDKPKYNIGDYVLIDHIYVIRDTLLTERLKKPLSARVIKNKGLTSLGYAYVLDIDFPEGEKPADLANVCYWEDHILIKMENPEETFWKIWGDR